MAKPLTTISADTARAFNAARQQMAALAQNTATRPPDPSTQTGARTVRFAETCTNAEYPNYPPDDPDCHPNTYLVRLGAPDFDPKAPGRSDFSFEPYDPPEYRVAHDPLQCRYWPEGSVLRVQLHHNEWYISEWDADECECPSSESSESSPSESVPSESSPSESSPSESSPSESSPSESSPSESSPSESSPSESSPSESSPSESSPSGSVPSGSAPSESAPPSESDKSTAIVPAAWSPTGFAALFTAEMPDVRFDDVLTATVTEDDSWLTIDPRFLDVCEPASVQVCGCVPDLPVLVGAVVQDDRIRVRLGKRQTDEPVRLVIRITGTRKGFRGHRFPERTREQFIANEAYLRSHYPGAGR